MGKYAATRAFQRDKKNNSNSWASVGSYSTDLPTTKNQFMFQGFLYGADPTGIYRGYMQARDWGNYWDTYLYNTGQSWSDIKYPTMMMGFGNVGSASRSSYMYFSENISKLYK